MRLLRMTIIFVVAAIAGLGVSQQAFSAPRSSSGSVLLTWQVVEDWGSGFRASATLTNRTGATIDPWQVSARWSTRVATVTGATVSQTSTTTTFRASAGTTTLANGGSATFLVTTADTASAPRAPKSCSAPGTTCSLSVLAGPSPSPTASPSPSPTASPSPTPTPTPTPSPSPSPSQGYLAPYVDMSGWPVPDLSALTTGSGITRYTLAFIKSAGGCTPAWGGSTALTMTSAGTQMQTINTSIAKHLAAGRELVLGYGGANGYELAETCTDVAALRDAYRAAVDKYGVDRIDLDIEGPAQYNREANVRRGQALAALQSDLAAVGRRLSVSLTLPVMPTGLTTTGLNVVRDSVAGGVRIDLVNVMAMNYGTAITVSSMGQAAIDAATSTAGQLAFVYPDLTAAQRLAKVGVTPMIGVNGVVGEIFTLADAALVRDWSRANGLGMLSWWSVRRDKPCADGGTQVSASCSGTTNLEWAYAAAFEG